MAAIKKSGEQRIMVQHKRVSGIYYNSLKNPAIVFIGALKVIIVELSD